MTSLGNVLQSFIVVGFMLIALGTSMPLAGSRSLPLGEDFDPLVDIAVTVEIQKIRAFDKFDTHLLVREYVDLLSDPDLYVKVFINGQEFTSDIWYNTKYIYEPWSATLNVPDDIEFVNVTIQLWDWNPGMDQLCDISRDYYNELQDRYDVELLYSIKTGHWFGDDYTSIGAGGEDPSGYGRLNGCDDNSIYQHDRDCELWFSISQNDFDHDNIPYWTEVNIYKTDPTFDDTGQDRDSDGCPIEWEHKWGFFRHWWHRDPIWFYNDSSWDDHATLDPDNDGLSNVEEYLTAQWGSDPFRKDLFIEMDIMEQCSFPESAKELLYTTYNRQNVVYHLDDGTWNDSGTDIIPYDELTEASYFFEDNELNQIYDDYFIQHEDDDWRKGVFHYGVVIYQSDFVNGNAFGSNRFQISSKGMEEKARIPYLNRDIVYASAYMHETGHTLGFWPIGGHDEYSKYPYQPAFWKWRPYKSCMNYGYMYKMVDYSDGSHGKNDFDDWDRLDLTYFQQTWD